MLVECFPKNLIILHNLLLHTKVVNAKTKTGANKKSNFIDVGELQKIILKITTKIKHSTENNTI